MTICDVCKHPSEAHPHTVGRVGIYFKWLECGSDVLVNNNIEMCILCRDRLKLKLESVIKDFLNSTSICCRQ